MDMTMETEKEQHKFLSRNASIFFKCTSSTRQVDRIRVWKSECRKPTRRGPERVYCKTYGGTGLQRFSSSDARAGHGVA